MRQSFRMRGVAPSVRILHSAAPARIFGPSFAYVWHMSGGVGFARARVVAWASTRVRARPVQGMQDVWRALRSYESLAHRVAPRVSMWSCWASARACARPVQGMQDVRRALRSYESLAHRVASCVSMWLCWASAHVCVRPVPCVHPLFPLENPSTAEACVGRPARRAASFLIAESSCQRKRFLCLKQDDSAAWPPEPYFSWGNALFEEAFDSALRGSTPRGGSHRPIFCKVSQSAPTPPTPQNIGELSTRMQVLVPFCSNQSFAPMVGRCSPFLLASPRRRAETALSPRRGAQFGVGAHAPSLSVSLLDIYSGPLPAHVRVATTGCANPFV